MTRGRRGKRPGHYIMGTEPGPTTWGTCDVCGQTMDQQQLAERKRPNSRGGVVVRHVCPSCAEAIRRDEESARSKGPWRHPYPPNEYKKPEPHEDPFWRSPKAVQERRRQREAEQQEQGRQG